MKSEISLEGLLITKLRQTVCQHHDCHPDDADNDSGGDGEETDMLLDGLCCHH